MGLFCVQLNRVNTTDSIGFFILRIGDKKNGEILLSWNRSI